jgi:hypothetical protein
MEHALHPPILKRSLVVPLAAAVLGAGVATATYAVVDSSQSPQAKVVFAQPSSSQPQTAEPQLMSGRRP